jgi:hypothetical protein
METPEKSWRSWGAPANNAREAGAHNRRAGKRYFEGAVKRIKASLPLSESEERELEEFGSRCSALLEQAHAHGRERLEALAEAPERGRYTSERSGRSRWRVKPAGEEWFVGAVKKACKGYIFRLSLRGTNTTSRFPDVLKLPPPELEELQLGWRASNEGRSARTYPMMTTPKAWQLLAWPACGPRVDRCAPAQLGRAGTQLRVASPRPRLETKVEQGGGPTNPARKPEAESLAHVLPGRRDAAGTPQRCAALR